MLGQRVREQMVVPECSLSPLICQEPAARLACAVICLQVSLQSKLPGRFSAPYAVLQSWPWDGQRKVGACALQSQVSAHNPGLSAAFLPVGLPNLRLLVNQHHAGHVNIRPRRRNPPRTQRTTLGVNVNILLSPKRKSHLEEKRRVKCRAQTEKADSEDEA